MTQPLDEKTEAEIRDVESAWDGPRPCNISCTHPSCERIRQDRIDSRNALRARIAEISFTPKEEAFAELPWHIAMNKLEAAKASGVLGNRII